VHEIIHSAKAHNKFGLFLKLDIKKAYDPVNWNFLRMILIQIGLDWKVVQWIMGCVNSVAFAILINGPPLDVFQAGRGLRQGCLLSPLLFLLVVDCLSRRIEKVKLEGKFCGFKVSLGSVITHLMFVDDIFILGSRCLYEWS